MAVSSQHYDDKIDEETAIKKKPEIITFYNDNKFGVDVVDQMCAICNVARSTRRWPWVHMFNLINISVINARVIYELNTKTKITRNDFTEQLAKSLINPHLQRRARSSSISYKTRILAGRLSNTPIEPSNDRLPCSSSRSMQTRMQALIAKRKARQKETQVGSKLPKHAPCFDCLKETGQRKITRQVCQMEGCSNFSCDDHYKKVCTECYNEILQ